jgi:hypothetical protein
MLLRFFSLLKEYYSLLLIVNGTKIKEAGGVKDNNI